MRQLNDSNWQMTALFLIALALVGFVMKLVALLVPDTSRISSADRPLMGWLFAAPVSLKRSLPVRDVRSVLFSAVALLAAVILGYWLCWVLIRTFNLRGILLSYLGVPILYLVSELLIAIARVFWLPSGRLIPALHCRPFFARSVAEFWAKRWNLWMSDWFRYVIFSRLRRTPVLALILVFAVSGVLHEWAINTPLFFVTERMLFGSMMLYFLLQAAGILIERRFLGRRPGLMILFAWLVVFVPSPLVLNEGLLRVLHLWPDAANGSAAVLPWVI